MLLENIQSDLVLKTSLNLSLDAQQEFKSDQKVRINQLQYVRTTVECSTVVGCYILIRFKLSVETRPIIYIYICVFIIRPYI